MVTLAASTVVVVHSTLLVVLLPAEDGVPVDERGVQLESYLRWERLERLLGKIGSARECDGRGGARELIKHGQQVRLTRQVRHV